MSQDNISKKIEETIKDIILQAGNKNEILVGDCHCNHNYTNTQKHILMLLKNENISNKELAYHLNISQAAVTKAIKFLINEDIIIPEKDPNDARIIKYILSEKAIYIAKEHEEHHKRTLNHYDNLLSKYSESEKKLISNFLDDLVKSIRG
ncbi:MULTISPECIES: MarR family transcriptional regulator [unclassified Gemella]|uniref:MarR family transcriptional regulator n=1 Tax=unclassified Gemella TaxID=2624949 RepID=UPI0010749C1C|nr:MULTISPECIES: MarR family transcriptional regulator [unclassified Gemella]MBF0710224.1 MarR family transcriptional regulator [Gemella sp. GL1.1]MBF0746524.1 MarR family transcriptional regulator [Gemella sp. 19428wG2_WT2a]NYS27568.1 MarR family transcriptional regulator [Gemella sp. GL1]TFU60302.1 MarR family transcriptional regulator [Gemella sp. WT2a]